MPKGYMVVEVSVHEPNGYQAYREQVMATVEAYGGRFLVRGGDPVLVEGEAPVGRIVVLEFESPEKAEAWYNSPAYQEILPLRLNAAKARAVRVTGA